MKTTPELKKAHGRMFPGVITKDGFLGTDARPLVDIIESDEERAAALGLDWNAAVSALTRLFDRAGSGFGTDVAVGDAWSVRIEENRGMLPCPFGDGLFGKEALRITDRATGKTMTLSLLSLHLIDAHHFLQGEGSLFRIDPSFLAELARRE